MKLHEMKFSGELLQRGFWIYVWRITTPAEEVLYVGRTGDSSSINAASPFTRIGHHLNSKPNAKANALYRRLKIRRLDPIKATFEMAAVGPLFLECATEASHCRCRNATGAIERAVGEWLVDRGYDVLSIDKTKARVDPMLFKQVKHYLAPRFPRRVGRNR